MSQTFSYTVTNITDINSRLITLTNRINNDPDLPLNSVESAIYDNVNSDIKITTNISLNRYQSTIVTNLIKFIIFDQDTSTRDFKNDDSNTQRYSFNVTNTPTQNTDCLSGYNRGSYISTNEDIYFCFDNSKDNAIWKKIYPIETYTGPTGQSIIGPTGQSIIGPTGQSITGPTGQSITGPTGSSITASYALFYPILTNYTISTTEIQWSAIAESNSFNISLNSNNIQLNTIGKYKIVLDASYNSSTTSGPRRRVKTFLKLNGITLDNCSTHCCLQGDNTIITSQLIYVCNNISENSILTVCSTKISGSSLLAETDGFRIYIEKLE